MKRRKRYALDNAIGEEHSYPILDTRIYELELLDGRVDEYVVNVIIENLVYHIDYQGWDTRILEEIVSFCSDPDVAIPVGEQSYTNFNVIQRQVITTKGWGVQVKWRDQSTDLVPLHLIT